jgi:hypothetical protein
MKGGITNVSYKNISKKRRRYISDLFTTLLGRRHFVFYTREVGANLSFTLRCWVGAILSSMTTLLHVLLLFSKIIITLTGRRYLPFLPCCWVEAILFLYRDWYFAILSFAPPAGWAPLRLLLHAAS